MFTHPARFCTPREHWPPFFSQKVDEIGNVSFLRPFIHVRNFHYIFGYTLVSPDLSHSQQKHLPSVETSKLSKVFLRPFFLITGACWGCGRTATS